MEAITVTGIIKRIEAFKMVGANQSWSRKLCCFQITIKYSRVFFYSLFSLHIVQIAQEQILSCGSPDGCANF